MGTINTHNFYAPLYEISKDKKPKCHDHGPLDQVSINKQSAETTHLNLVHLELSELCASAQKAEQLACLFVCHSMCPTTP
jgi:hypothetical protein